MAGRLGTPQLAFLYTCQVEALTWASYPSQSLVGRPQTHLRTPGGLNSGPLGASSIQHCLGVGEPSPCLKHAQLPALWAGLFHLWGRGWGPHRTLRALPLHSSFATNACLLPPLLCSSVTTTLRCAQTHQSSWISCQKQELWGLFSHPSEAKASLKCHWSWLNLRNQAEGLVFEFWKNTYLPVPGIFLSILPL